MANHRLVDLTHDQVRFRWKDYRHEAQVKTITLAATEFIRRFLLHVLPSGFQRIRYYGLLGNRHRAAKLAQCRRLLGMSAPSADATTSVPAADHRDRVEALTGISLRRCPLCQVGHMILIDEPSRLAPVARGVDSS
jgi:hypothetical protein